MLGTPFQPLMGHVFKKSQSQHKEMDKKPLKKIHLRYLRGTAIISESLNTFA